LQNYEGMILKIPDLLSLGNLSSGCYVGGMKTVEDHNHTGLPEEASRLFDEALKRYDGPVLWNMRPSKTISGLKSLARALEKRGDLAAAGLAQELRKSVLHAA